MTAILISITDLCAPKSMHFLCVEPLETEKMSWN